MASSILTAAVGVVASVLLFGPLGAFAFLGMLEVLPRAVRWLENDEGADEE